MSRPAQLVFALAIAWISYPSSGCGGGGGPPPPGPTVFGVAPSEAKAGDEVWISGYGFNLYPLDIVLLDPATGTTFPVIIRNIAANRVKVETPKDEALGLVGRKGYRLRVNGGGYIVNPAADVIHLWKKGEDKPRDGEWIKVRLIRWRPGYDCTHPIGGPYECSCEGLNYMSGGAVAHGLLDPNPSDGWTGAFWSVFREHFDDTSREWSAMCSESWTGQPTPWIRGVQEETDQRVTLYSYAFYFLDVEITSKSLSALARRKSWGVQGYPNPEEEFDFCGGIASLGHPPPSDCDVWKPNTASPRVVNVHLVGAFYENGQELDPAIGVGMGLPVNFVSNLAGMVVMTDNPQLGNRKRFINLPPTCPGSHYQDNQSPINKTYWWGGDLRPLEPTPNLFSHELHHVLTGWLHTAPDPCYSPAVGQPMGTCPRGFNMKLSTTQTAASECQRAIAGFGGADYTRE